MTKMPGQNISFNMKKILKKTKEHFRNMARVFGLHGPLAVFGIYLSKVPYAEKVVRHVFGGMKVKTTILGSTMYLDVFDRGLHRRLLMRGIREEEHVEQIKSGVRSGMTGIELGANIGYFGLLEARLVGETGMIYCIEPAPDNMSLLLKHTRVNHLQDRTKTFQYLIGDHDGPEKLYLSEFSNVHSLSSKINDRGFVEVPMVTMDTFMDQNGLSPEDVDFIRMDIEGYEVKAFEGMKKLFTSSSPLMLFMEFHPMYYGEWGWSLEKLLRSLYDQGFRIREIAKHREYDEHGKLRPVILKNPSLEEVLASSVFNGNEGSQAFLEKA